MTKDTAVIQAFHIPLDETDLTQLQKTHTYISDKLILDSVNGIKVAARDLNNVSKSRESLAWRAFEGVTGGAAKRQNLIIEHLIEGVNACTAWLRDHDNHLNRIDARICSVAEELSRTQGEILKFYEQHLNLKQDVSALEESLSSFKESAGLRLNALERWVQDVDVRDKAYNLINREFEALKAGKYEHLDTPIQIYSVLDNIKSGDGGLYYHSTQEKEKNEYRVHIQNKLINFIQDSFDKSYIDEFIDFQSLIHKTSVLNPMQQKAISFISTQHYNTMLEYGQSLQVADLVSIVSTFSGEEAEKEIAQQSHISNFISYGDFINDATKEHLLA